MTYWTDWTDAVIIALAALLVIDFIRRRIEGRKRRAIFFRYGYVIVVNELENMAVNSAACVNFGYGKEFWVSESDFEDAGIFDAINDREGFMTDHRLVVGPSNRSIREKLKAKGIRPRNISWIS